MSDNHEPDPTIQNDDQAHSPESHNATSSSTSRHEYVNENNPNLQYIPQSIIDPFDKRNPFEHAAVNTYSHRPSIVPPYVLDKLSQVHYKEQLNNSNTNAVGSEEEQHHNQSHSKNHHYHNHLHIPTVSSVIKPINRHPHITNHNNGNGHGNGHGRHQSTSSSGDEDKQYLSFANDPFVRSMGNNWHNFLHTVQQPNSYTPNVTEYDRKFNADWDLNGTWGGEERLKNALLGNSSADEDSSDQTERASWFSRWFSRKSSNTEQKSSRLNNELNEPSPRVRSKAGYWMSDEKRADLKPTLKRFFLQNPLIPLLLRILIIIFCLLSLALACSIFVLSGKQTTPVEQQPSTFMAIIVQCLAIAYLCYIAYDEYHGKPLGLRDPVEKMKLILLDLLFIIFSSANLSLTFNTLYDPQWVCKAFDLPGGGDRQTTSIYPTIGSLCRRQRALSSFLFLALVLWVITFTISIVRVVDKVSSANPRSD